MYAADQRQYCSPTGPKSCDKHGSERCEAHMTNPSRATAECSRSQCEDRPSSGKSPFHRSIANSCSRASIFRGLFACDLGARARPRRRIATMRASRSHPRPGRDRKVLASLVSRAIRRGLAIDCARLTQRAPSARTSAPGMLLGAHAARCSLIRRDRAGSGNVPRWGEANGWV